jgi:hypothetical protein
LFFGIGSIDAKFKCSTFDANQNSFFMFEAFKSQDGLSFYFKC